MYEFIKGSIVELTPTRVILENNGIGYDIEISLQTYEELQGKNDAKVFIYHYLREDCEQFYGFATKDERSIFMLIIGVSGIGVSSARMMLSTLSSSELRNAILSEDINKIKSVKGIGLKSAQRIILELKDKIVKGEGSAEDGSLLINSSVNIEEATTALTLLGFSKPNVTKALQSIVKINPSAKVEELIKAALQIL